MRRRELIRKRSGCVVSLNEESNSCQRCYFSKSQQQAVLWLSLSDNSHQIGMRSSLATHQLLAPILVTRWGEGGRRSGEGLLVPS